MMIQEFASRTGYTPTSAEYKRIEQEYLDCDDDKDTFCAKWVLSQKRAAREEIFYALVTCLEKNEKRLGEETPYIRAIKDYVDFFHAAMF